MSIKSIFLFEKKLYLYALVLSVMQIKSILAGLMVLFLVNAHSQGLTCAESDPFCTGTIYNFPAGTTGNAEPGPYYGCLLQQPAPAWYHMKIGNPGPITIYMYSTPLKDIDFICWGPFTDPFTPCSGGLTISTMVDCSYLPDPEEWCDIPYGQTGEYYILLITNFSRSPCDITFSQTSGTGSTDCSILPPLVSNDSPLCVGDTLHLHAETIANATYAWTGPGGFTSTLQDPVIPNVTLADSGDYSCIVTVFSQSSPPAITTVLINDLPDAFLVGNDTTICPGFQAYMLVQLFGAGPFEVIYYNGSNYFNAPGLTGPVDTIYVNPPGPATYTLTQVSDTNCTRELTGTAYQVYNYPSATGVMTGDATICQGDTAQLVFNLTGSPPWNITYLTNGMNPLTVVANSTPFILLVNPLVTTQYQFTQLSDAYCTGTASGQVLITVNFPTGNLSGDNTICTGGTAQLIFVLTGFPPWTITYTANGTDEQTVIATYSPFSVAVSPFVSTLYEFTQLEDVFCNGAASGQAMITIHEPAGELSGSTTLCAGGTAQLMFELTGLPPWTIAYTANGVDEQTVIATYSPFYVAVSPLVNTLYEFTYLNDALCTGTTSGQAEITIQQPSGELSGSATVCAGGSAQITFNLTGIAPWSITYTENGENPQTVIATYSPFNVTVSPLVNSLYEFTQLEDAFCTGTTSGQAMITIHVPTGELSGSATVCAGESAQITFSLTGTPPWSITYTENGENPQTVIATYSPFNVAVNPLINTLYEFTQLEEEFCAGTVSGQAMITVHQISGELSGSATVCAGESAAITFNLTGTPPWSIIYTGNGENPQTFIASYSPFNVTVNPLVSTLYEFIQLEDELCSGTVSGQAMITIHQPTGELSGSATICAGEFAQINFNLTGIPPWSIIYTENGINPQTVTVYSTSYNQSVSPLITTIYEFSWFEDDSCPGITSGEALITVNPDPIVNAGVDKTIPNGTSTMLEGEVTGGSGSFTYQWQPADQLENALVLQPMTVILFSSTLFYLTATDDNGGCFKTDETLVTITGGVLSTNSFADPPLICQGETSQLQAIASGGSGDYTYTWLSDPPGFSSGIQNPVVNPVQTTSYSVTVSDGYSIAQANTTVTVLPLPIPDAGPDEVITYGTPTVLQGSATAGSGVYNYH